MTESKDNKKKTSKDPNELAAFIVETATGEPIEPSGEKNPLSSPKLIPTRPVNKVKECQLY